MGDGMLLGGGAQPMMNLVGGAAPMSGPQVQFSMAEIAFYRNLWSMVVTDGSDKLHGIQARDFMEKSGVPRNVLHQIWCAVDPHQAGYLTPDSFNMCMRLVAHAQSNPAASALTTELMMQEPPSLPNFEGLHRKRSPSECSTGNISTNLDDIPRVMGSSLDPHRAMQTALAQDQSSYALRPIDMRKYASVFLQNDLDQDGFVDAAEAKELLERSGLSNDDLCEIWQLADRDQDGKLNFREFIVAMHLVTCFKKRGKLIPVKLPYELEKVLDEGNFIDNPEIIMQQPRPPGSRSASPYLRRDYNDAQELGGSVPRGKSSRSRGASPHTPTYMPEAAGGGGRRGRSPTRRDLPSFGYDDPTSAPDRIRRDIHETRDIMRLEGVIEADRRLCRFLQREVDAVDSNVQTYKDMAENLERDTRREAREKDRLQNQSDDFRRQVAFYKKQLGNLKDEFRKASLEAVSIRRDRDHYAEEAAFLSRAVEAVQRDLSLFTESEMQIDKAYHQCDLQIQQLERQRKEIADDLKAEKEKMRSDERINAEFKAKIDRLQREAQTAFSPEVSPREKPREMLKALESTKKGTPATEKDELNVEHSWAAFLRNDQEKVMPHLPNPNAPERKAPYATFREGV